jgi:hypothetical protein
VQRQKTILDKTTKADYEGTEKVANAEAQRILEEARLKAEQVLARAKAEAERIQRELALKQAQGKVEDSKNQVAIDKAEEEARKVVLRQKAAQPDIQAKLAPFITPGTWQLKGPATVDPKPLSFTQLKSGGVLEPAALQKLVNIAITISDKVRPRWKFSVNMHIDRCRPDEIKAAREAQELLSELGPVLVEMNLLQP